MRCNGNENKWTFFSHRAPYPSRQAAAKPKAKIAQTDPHTHTRTHTDTEDLAILLTMSPMGGGDTGERHRNGHGGRLWKFTTLLRLVAPIAGHTEIE